MSLDRNRPFSQIYGYCAEYPGARFEQDGRFFGPEGNEVARAETVPETDDEQVTAPTYTVDDTPAPPAPEAEPDPGTVYEASKADLDVDRRNATADTPVTEIQTGRARNLLPGLDADQLHAWLAEERRNRKRGVLIKAIKDEIESRGSEHPESETAQTPG